jgi:L,D-transpeptidase ErfK/SrfK
MNLGWPSYLVHGTNKPYGVGMRSSHGCIRFYPEDIALLFDQIPVRAPVHVVNQSLLMGWRDGALYVQALPVMEDDPTPTGDATEALLNAAISDEHWQKAKANGAAVDLLVVAQLAKERRGVATPVSRREVTPEKYLAAAPRAYNRIPNGATWDGREELLISAEEYEAVRDGKPLPKRPAENKRPAQKVAEEPSKPQNARPNSVAPTSSGVLPAAAAGTAVGAR